MNDFYYNSKDILDKAIGTDAYFQIKSILTSTKAADVATVVHGQWKLTEYPFMSECEDCSNCGYRTMYGHGFKFCPNCGARMDGTDGVPNE